MTTQAHSRRIRIATYNVHACVGTDFRRDPDRVAGVLQELNCDVIGLQEIENIPEHDRAMQLDYIARATGFEAIPGLTLKRRSGHYGNALLTRFKPIHIERHDFSYLNQERRGALDVQLHTGTRVLRFIVTHLGLLPAERRHQMKLLIELVRRVPNDQVVVVVGDMNEWHPWGQPLRWMNEFCGVSVARRTFPSFMPVFALDRVWARPTTAVLDVRAYRSPLARLASDHLPVVATLEMD